MNIGRFRVSAYSRYIYTGAAISLALAWPVAGCTADSPDTSAPQRVEIERSSDWMGALLYIADEDGPTPDWGSVRIYDNVSGFVEASVEQTLAASPADMYVTDDGSSMFVASRANGRIDRFSWNGNTWERSNRAIASPASSLLTLIEGPSSNLYAAEGAPPDGVGRIFAFDIDTETFDDEAIVFPAFQEVRGISWSTEGDMAYVSGQSAGGSLLEVVSWPSRESRASINLPLPSVNQVITSPDGSSLYILGQGAILRFDPHTKMVTGTFKPDPYDTTVYIDADFSADGRYLFATGARPGGDSSLHVIDLDTGDWIHFVPHISRQAGGIQRVE